MGITSPETPSTRGRRALFRIANVKKLVNTEYLRAAAEMFVGLSLAHI